MKHPRLYLISVSVLMFGLQALFVRAFHLFFTQIDAQALIPWSFLGILISCLLLSANHLAAVKRVTELLNLRFVSIVLLLYAISCLYIIHFIPALFMVVLVNTGLGMCLARAAMSLEAYRFYTLDFLGGIAGCVVAFFLPQYFNLEATYFLLISLAILSATFTETLHHPRRWQLASALIVISTVYLGLFPLKDLSQYGATFQKPDDYALAPSRHGQLNLQSGRGDRIFSGWSSVGKVEVHASKIAQGPVLDFFINNINVFSLTPEQPKIFGNFGKDKRALVIGAGGGWEMRFLQDQGFADITGVEINEVIFDLAVNRFDDMGEKVFSKHKAVLGEGRNFVEMDKTKYDLIIVRYLGAAGGLIGSIDDLSENYLFTTEAFRTYYDHLKPGGLLMTGTSYSKDPDPNPALLRTSESLTELLRAQGEDPATNMWILGEERLKYSLPERRYRAVFFLRKGLVPNAQLIAEEKFIDGMQKSVQMKKTYLVYHPTNFTNSILSYPEKFSSQEEYTRESIKKSVAQEIAAKYDLDISPTPDERPYFYQYAASPQFPLKPAGFLFWACCALLVCMIAFLSKFPIQRQAGDFRLLALSGALGFAYGILEIALLNAFTIAFSSISWNFSLLIFGLLGGSTLAGLLGGKMNTWVRKAFILGAALGLMSLYLFDFKTYIMLYDNQYERSLILIGATLIISFGASLTYPLLLKKSENTDARMPAFILGINSGFFIIGSIACRYLALVLSLKHVFFAAGFIYLCVVFLIPATNGVRSRLRS